MLNTTGTTPAGERGDVEALAGSLAAASAHSTTTLITWRIVTGIGAVYGTKYRGSLPDLSQLPARAAGAVRESPASGLHVASGFGPHGDTLAAAVRSAFLHGLAASLIAVAAILAVSAVVAFVRAPHVLPETE